MIRPLQDKVVLKLLEQDHSTKSGIVISDLNQDSTKLAIVVSIGKLEDLEIKPNDKVLIRKGVGTNFKCDDEDFIVVNMEDILVVLD